MDSIAKLRLFRKTAMFASTQTAELSKTVREQFAYCTIIRLSYERLVNMDIKEDDDRMKFIVIKAKAIRPGNILVAIGDKYLHNL